MELAPIIVFAYNRPFYLKETLSALSLNEQAAGSDLYIYCDGPKANANEKDLDLIKQVRQLAYEKKWCKNVFVIEATANNGLSRSVVTGVTEVVNKYGKVIVIEDDIVVAPFFLKYMNEALELYKEEPRVASISGYNYPVGHLIKNKETFFLKSISSWGWATWKEAWALYNDDAAYLLSELKRNNLESEFNFNNTHRYVRMLKLTIAGKIDSWAIKWYASCFLGNKLNLFPVHSMVKNIGMNGTHVVGDNRDFLGDQYYPEAITNFEDNINENNEIKAIWQNHYKYYDRRKLNYRNIKYGISKIKMKFNL